MAFISKSLGVIPQSIRNANLNISARVTLGLGTLMTFAQTQITFAGENANIRGALDTNQEALEAVADSSFTAEGVQETSQSFLNTLLYAVGALGVALVVAGIWNLWNHFNEGEQARGKATTGILLCVIGGLMTIPAIITGIAPLAFVGEG